MELQKKEFEVDRTRFREDHKLLSTEKRRVDAKRAETETKWMRLRQQLLSGEEKIKHGQAIKVFFLVYHTNTRRVIYLFFVVSSRSDLSLLIYRRPHWDYTCGYTPASEKFNSH